MGIERPNFAVEDKHFNHYMMETPPSLFSIVNYKN